MIWVQSTSYKPNTQIFICRSLYFPRAEPIGRITVKNQCQQRFRRYCLSTMNSVAFVYCAQIQLRNHVDNKSRQLIRRNGFSKTDLYILCRCIIGFRKFSCHCLSVPIFDVFNYSDRLLEIGSKRCSIYTCAPVWLN